MDVFDWFDNRTVVYKPAEDKEIISVSPIHKTLVKHCLEVYSNENINQRIDICQEELAELIQALSKYKRQLRDDFHEDAKPMIIEEIADVLSLISQVAYILNITPEDIDCRFNHIYPVKDDRNAHCCSNVVLCANCGKGINLTEGDTFYSTDAGMMCGYCRSEYQAYKEKQMGSECTNCEECYRPVYGGRHYRTSDGRCLCYQCYNKREG